MKPATRILLLVTGVFAGGVGAETWAPVPGDSALTFTAEQQGAEFQGEFREFTATFDLDPADPTGARIEAAITVAEERFERRLVETTSALETRLVERMSALETRLNERMWFSSRMS